MTAQAPTSLYEISANMLDGSSTTLERYKGKVLLIVNTASQCGFTPQYKGLQSLQEQFADLEVLGFPCNQFGTQEPGDAAQIQSFCETSFGVTFPMFEKIEVNGANAHPLYLFLTNAAPGILGTKGIKWNFTKFLIDRNGNVVKRYGSTTKPEAIAKDIEGLL